MVSFIRKLIKPFTLVGPASLSISGGEERTYLFFEDEGSKNSVEESIRKMIPSRCLYNIHHEYDLSNITNEIVASLIQQNFQYGLHIVTSTYLGGA